MHSLLEGVVKSLFKMWFESERSAPYCLKSYMQEIDKRLLKIKPPRFVPSAPRSIYTYHLWRAHEILAFIVYYALPVFDSLLHRQYYDNLVKLVIFIEKLLAPKIDIDELEKLEELVYKFVQEAEDLYPENFMTSGTHELLHLVDGVRDFGSLNAVNCFPFEELNRKICRLFHGKDLIGEEIINNFYTLQELSAYTVKSQNIQLKEFICKKLMIKTSNSKKIREVMSQTGKASLTKNKELIDLYNSFHNDSIDSISIFHKVIYDGIVYSSSDRAGKKDDSCVHTPAGIGIIKSFHLKDKRVFACCQKIVPIYEPFYHDDIQLSMARVSISNELFITQCNQLKKLLLIQLSENQAYISKYSISHLFS